MPLAPETINILRAAWQLRQTGESFEEYVAEFERKNAHLFEKARWKDWEQHHTRDA